MRWVPSIRDLLEFCDLVDEPDAWQNSVSSEWDLEVEVEVHEHDDDDGEAAREGDDGEAAREAARARHTVDMGDHLHLDGSYFDEYGVEPLPRLPEYLDGMYD